MKLQRKKRRLRATRRRRAAQRALVANLHLSEELHDPPPVTGFRLRGELAEARKQVERAQAVVDGLIEAIDGLSSQLPPEQRR